MSPEDIKLDYKVSLLPGNKQHVALLRRFLIAEVFGWQQAVAGEQPPVWTLPPLLTGLQETW